MRSCSPGRSAGQGGRSQSKGWEDVMQGAPASSEVAAGSAALGEILHVLLNLVDRFPPPVCNRGIISISMLFHG